MSEPVTTPVQRVTLADLTSDEVEAGAREVAHWREYLRPGEALTTGLSTFLVGYLAHALAEGSEPARRRALAVYHAHHLLAYGKTSSIDEELPRLVESTR